MKQKFWAVVLLLCIMAAFVLPTVKAADPTYFSVANNVILPLTAETMPIYSGGRYYVPYTFFSSGELGVFAQTGDKKVLLYANVSKRLTLDALSATIIDQDGYQYYQYAPMIHNGIVYVPVEMVCNFFGLTWSVINTTTTPASIVRITSKSPIINESTFVSLFKDQLNNAYNVYTGVTVSTPPTPTPSASSSSPPTTNANETVYLSLYDLSGGRLDDILDALGDTYYRTCIFVTGEEIAENAPLLRRAAAAGHSFGIWLREGTYNEYRETSELLFEATKMKTVLVAADGDNESAAEEMSEARHLIFWQFTRSYDKSQKFSASTVTGRLSASGGPLHSLNFDCSDKAAAVIPAVCDYLSEYKYSVRRINETSAPVLLPN